MRHSVPCFLFASAILATLPLLQCAAFDMDGVYDDSDDDAAPPHDDGGPGDARDDRYAPLPPGLNAVAVATGDAHSCAFNAEGALYCWGSNELGQLGLTLDLAATSIPKQVVLPDVRVVAVALGAHHTCVVSDFGNVICWGSNDRGQLGRPASLWLPPAPILVPTSLTGVVFQSVWARGATTCASYREPEVLDAGDDATPTSSEPIVRVACWGDNAYGQLAREDVTATHEAMVIRRGGNPVAVSAFALGGDFVLGALRASGAVRAQSWGRSLFEVTDAEPGASAAPSSVLDPDGMPLDDVLAVGAGRAHACILQRKFEAVDAADAGDAGDLEELEEDADVQDAEDADGEDGEALVDAAPPASFAQLICWGSNDSGQLLRSDGGREVTAVGTFATTAQLALGADVTCVVEDSVLRCAGANDQGQLGVGSFDTAAHPNPSVIEALPSLVVHASVGGRHVCALVLANATTAQIACWGDNRDGQLGDAMSLGSGYDDGELRSARPVYVVPAGTRQPTALRNLK